jgi:Amt family ammonium transporter
LFADMGVLDFAGGIVVHITAGIAALVVCIVIGPRTGWPMTLMAPHNLGLTVAGTGMLWVGWFGFNGGSALASSGSAAMALVVTHLSASAAAITWMAIEWARHKKPSVLGICTGAVAGLAAVTPASGYIGPVGALAIGIASGALCFVAATQLKQRFGYDDSLDVFGVHGVGGFLGTVLAGLFCSPAFGGLLPDRNIATQIGVQILAALCVAAYTAIVTFALAKGVDAWLGLRVADLGEEEGLDLYLHGERGYNL